MAMEQLPLWLSAEKSQTKNIQEKRMTGFNSDATLDAENNLPVRDVTHL